MKSDQNDQSISGVGDKDEELGGNLFCARTFGTINSKCNIIMYERQRGIISRDSN